MIPGMDERPSDHRRRLLDAMARAVASKGYAAVTIADLATEARVSKRSFYEQFRDKADCFIALFDASTEQTVRVLHEALEPQAHWSTQLPIALDAYLSGLARNPTLLHTMFVDIMAIGPVGLAARRRWLQQLVDLLVRRTDGAVQSDQALALVSGLHEWVLRAMETHQVDQLPGLAPDAARLLGRIANAEARALAA